MCSHHRLSPVSDKSDLSNKCDTMLQFSPGTRSDAPTTKEETKPHDYQNEIVDRY